ncbi:MAG: ABC transporter permease [Candidatus Delongbacteria bacterium]|nr:ABC transporter permease [Candidatus Delongbacteria bacterium]
MNQSFQESSPHSGTCQSPYFVIRPHTGLLRINFHELWQYRELFWFLVWRDIKVKYKQTALGALWAILVPFLQMMVFTVIFGKIAKLPTDGLNPLIFYYAGLIPWTYFSTSLSFASNSLVGSKQLLTKIYFPRLIIPTSPCLAALVDFAIAFLILGVMMIWFAIPVDAAVLLLPLMMLIAFGTALGTGLFFSALNVQYRDIGYALPFVVQIWMYASVILPFSKIPASWGIWRYLYGLNPMGGVIEGFRWCLLHRQMVPEIPIGTSPVSAVVPPPIELIAIGSVVMLLILAAGLAYFRKMEETFADIV